MGKVKDESAAKPSKSSSKGGSKEGSGGLRAFTANLLRSDLYKAPQGRHARTWTGIGVGVILLFGVWRLFVTLERVEQLTMPARYAIAAALAAAFGWLAFRLVHFPPFADFLIATEAEMKKVSWISREDLKRATSVVLVTVVIISIYLLGVDFVWMRLLQFIGVLQVTSEGFGSTA